MKLRIVTPMHGGLSNGWYDYSMREFLRHLALANIPSEIETVFGGTLLADTRNQLAESFLKGDCTDVLYVDNDSAFNAEDTIRAIRLTERPEYGIIGVPFVKKLMDWKRVRDAVAAKPDINPDVLPAIAGEYNFRVSHDGPYDFTKLIEVPDIGMGLMIIRRDVLEKMAPAVPTYWHHKGDQIHEFFRMGPDESGQYCGEDVWFCKQARAAGFKVWMAPWVRTSHVGYYAYKGDLLAIVKAGGEV